jgi:hypothetical protein
VKLNDMPESLKKLSPVFLLVFVSVIFYLITNFCESRTDGFSIAFIHSDLTYNPAWETEPISKETHDKLETVFSQKFRYLGCGGQSFVFVSENNEHVIKFFKHRNFRKPYSFFLKLPLPSVLELSRLCKLNRALFKLNRDFTSYKLAYEELQEETGLIYIHLNKGTELNRTLNIIDKMGIEHEIDLDKIEFVVQKRAEPLYPRINKLVTEGDLIGAKQTLHAILEVIVARCKKGIFDEDPRIHNNLGFIGQRAIFIDVGRFVRDTERSVPSVYMNDLKTIISKRFRPWLERCHPQLIADLDEEIDQFEHQ